MKKPNNKSQTFDIKFWTILILFISVGGLLFWLAPGFVVKSTWAETFGELTGPIGDTIGGIIGPAIAFIAAILTFLAFWIQYRANEQQKEDLKIERFENKFFKLIEFHRMNVNEMAISSAFEGQKCFIQMYYEYKYVYLVVERLSASYEKDKKQTIDTNDLAYSIFFYGFNNESKKMLQSKFNYLKDDIFESIEKKMIENQEGFESLDKQNKDRNAHDVFKNTESGIDFYFYYYPFDGHINKLGNYFRNLKQIVDFISDKEFLSEDQKKEYFRILRSQLSDYEQIHIFFNVKTWFWDEWKEVVEDYKLLKNIPHELIDFYKN